MYVLKCSQYVDVSCCYAGFVSPGLSAVAANNVLSLWTEVVQAASWAFMECYIFCTIF